MQEETITINQLNLAALRFGNPKGPLLLALHGWLDNAMSFAPIAPYLNEYNLLAIDFPGHGHSDHFKGDLPYHFVDAVLYMMDLIDAQNWDQLILLGHSMGGGIATLLAGLIPEKISKLIIIEGLGPLTETADTTPAQINTYFRHHKKLKKHKHHPYPSLDAMTNARAQKGYIGFDNAKLISERGAQKINDIWFWRHDPKLYLPSPIRFTEEQVLAVLKNITAKTCLIMGENGFRYDETKIQGRIQTIAQLETHIVPGGHHCHMEHADKVSSIVKLFCSL